MEQLSPYELLVAGWVSGHGYGFRIEGVHKPEKWNDLEEPSLVWEWRHESTLPTLTPSEDSPLPGLLRLVDDPSICDTEPASWEYIEKFAAAYGPLELCEHALPHTHHPDCYPTEAEPVSAWFAWAQVFHAAETGAPIPDAASDRLKLPARSSAREIIDWLARGFGSQARSPREGWHYGLFERLAGAAPPSGSSDRQKLCPNCGVKPPRGPRASYCGDCVKLRNRLKRQRDRRRDTSARHILRSVLPDRKDPGYPEALREIAEPRTVLGIGVATDPLSKRVRSIADVRYKALMRKRPR